MLECAERDVVVGTDGVTHRILRHDRDVALPALGIEIGDVDAVDGDAARRRVTPPREQTDQCRLAGAIGADDRRRRPGLKFEIET